MILQNPNKILREKSKEISTEEIKNSKIKKVISEMKEELLKSIERDGVALAAPQIGYNLRIFIILKDLAEISKKGFFNEEDFEKRRKNKNYDFLVFINPEIIKRSKKNLILSEGCLSVSGYFGKVKRSEKVTIKAYDENGKEFQMSASKILSQAFQHELDHLDGGLFIDRAVELQKIKK